jgi:GNAT superfamily N-acetyltransferase
MRLISVREKPDYRNIAISYIQNKWATETSRMVYEDCITHAITTSNPLPQWYLLEDESGIIGCAGLITNDFISRMDLYPWVCAVFIDEPHRGKAYGALLLEQAKRDAKKGGFSHLYLCTDLVGYYEKYGFTYIGTGYQPWGRALRIYGTTL